MAGNLGEGVSEEVGGAGGVKVGGARAWWEAKHELASACVEDDDLDTTEGEEAQGLGHALCALG